MELAAATHDGSLGTWHQGDFRSRAPWSPSSSSRSRCFGASSAPTLLPNGWPPAPAIEGLFEPLPADAERFPWEFDDGIWVNGTLADGYLRTLMKKGAPQSTAMRITRPRPDGEVPRFAPQRGRCQAVNSGKSACSCLCTQYTPTLILPLTLLDKLELINDVRPTARKILAESNIAAHLRRAGVERGDVYLDVVFKPSPPISAHHRVCFRVREERITALVESAGDSLAGVIEEKVQRAEYELNMQMLPHLKKWCERYRSVKVTRQAEAARVLAEEAAHDAALAREKGQGQQQQQLQQALGLGLGPLAEALGASGKRPKTPEAPAATAAHEGLGRPYLCCHCGHGEVWHERPREEVAPQASPSGDASPRASGSAAKPLAALPPPLRPKGPAGLVSNLPPQGPVFGMIADAPKPQAPRRNPSEATISGGKLLLKAGFAALQRPMSRGKVTAERAITPLSQVAVASAPAAATASRPPSTGSTVTATSSSPPPKAASAAAAAAASSPSGSSSAGPRPHAALAGAGSSARKAFLDPAAASSRSPSAPTSPPPGRAR